MEIDISIYNETGGYNPYTLSWGQEIEFPSTRKLIEYGNRVYNRYPARSIFTVPRAILSQHKNERLNVLDPFMGSGTTAVETVLSGNIAFGTEMDPFARMVTEASTTIYTKEELKKIKNLYHLILQNWENYNPDSIPELIGIDRWFKDGDLNRLLSLRACIRDIVSKKYSAFFMVVFADCIKPVSKMERQSTKPYISSRFEKKTKNVTDSFEYSFNSHFNAISEMSSKLAFEKQKTVKWLGFDATSFQNADNTIDMAITSPPYINAFDYSQCIKVESALCGIMDNSLISQLREVQVGHSKRRKQGIFEIVISSFKTEYEELFKVNSIKAETCMAYFNDIYKNLLCVQKSLKKGGEYHIIIGDSIISGIEIPTHTIISRLATSIGFEWFGYYFYRIKDHRTSIPRDHDTSKIKIEHVLMLRK